MTKTHYKNIEEALRELRPEDKVLKILSNKYAVVQSRFIGGGLDTPSVCGLNESKIHFYCKWFNEAKANFAMVARMPSIERKMIAFYTNPKLQVGCEWRRITIDNRKYKRHYRKIHQLLKANYRNDWLK